MGLPISVIIPAHQNAEELNRCINSILDSDYQDYEIVVVDDASLPPLRNGLPENKKLVYVYQEKQQGAAAARNIGAEASKYDIIYFVDSDVEVYRQNLGRIAEHFSHPHIKAVSGINNLVPLNKGYMATYQAFFEYFILYHPQIEFVNLFNSRNVAIRKELFLNLNGFDTSFGTTLEEVEFAQRLVNSGIKVKNDTELLVRHTYPSSLKKAVFNHFRRGFAWFRIYLIKKGKTATVSGASPNMVRGIFMHFLFFAALFASLFSLNFLWLALGFYLLHLKYFTPFYRICFEKKGLFFTVRVMGTKLIMSFVLGLSQFFSLISIPFYRKNVL